MFTFTTSGAGSGQNSGNAQQSNFWKTPALTRNPAASSTTANGFTFNQTSGPTGSNNGFGFGANPTTQQPNGFGFSNQPTQQNSGFGTSQPTQQPSGFSSSGFTFQPTQPAQQPNGFPSSAFNLSQPAQTNSNAFGQPTPNNAFSASTPNAFGQPTQNNAFTASRSNAFGQPTQSFGLSWPRSLAPASAVQGNTNGQTSGATRPGSLAVDVVADPYGIREKLRRSVSSPSHQLPNGVSIQLAIRPITPPRYEDPIPRRNSAPTIDIPRDFRRRASMPFRDVTSRTVNYTPSRRSYKMKSITAPFKPATAFKKKKELVVSLNKSTRSRVGMRLANLRGPSIPRLSRGRWN